MASLVKHTMQREPLSCEMEPQPLQLSLQLALHIRRLANCTMACSFYKARLRSAHHGASHLQNELGVVLVAVGLVVAKEYIIVW